MQNRFLLAIVTTIIVFAVFAQTAQVRTLLPTLRKISEFDLPGPTGKRFDYLTIDPDDHYLISAHLAAEQTYVIDLRTYRVVATVANTPSGRGRVRTRIKKVLNVECR